LVFDLQQQHTALRRQLGSHGGSGHTGTQNNHIKRTRHGNTGRIKRESLAESWKIVCTALRIATADAIGSPVWFSNPPPTKSPANRRSVSPKGNTGGASTWLPTSLWKM